jgi:single-stranded-DNA-specific exonuclease
LEPFGEGNPEPVFLFENPEIENIKTSADGKHLFATINSFRAVWWNHGSEIDDVIAKTGGEIKISFTIEKSNFNGNTSVELRINDME